MKKKLLVLVTIAVMCLSIFAVMLTGCKDDKPFTVAFDSNGGNEIASVVGKVETEPVPIRKGYDFLGWYMENSEERVVFPFEPTANLTLKAKWKVGQEGQPPTDKVLTASDIVGLVVNAMSENTKFNADNNYGIQLGISTWGGVALLFETAVDPKDSSSLKMGLKVKKDSTDIFQLLADDEYLYAISSNLKRRFTDVNLAELIDTLGVDMSSTTSLVKLALNVAMSSVFSDDTEVVKTNKTYMLDGTLEGLLDFLEVFNVELPSIVKDVLKNVTFTLTTDIVDGKASNVKVGIADINGAEIGVTKFNISNDEIPQINVPSKTDKSFVETYLLNYTLTGSVVLQNRQSNYTVKNLVEYDYELRVNFNIMEAIRNCLTKDAAGKIVFNAANLFKTKDSKIFFDLTHTCSDQCADYCSNKEGAARGSILSIAYSPADFKSENINIAVNIKNILPKGFISSFIDLGSLNLLSLFGEYVGLPLNPEALITNASISDDDSTDSDTDADSQFSIDTNYIGVVLDALKFIGGITFTQSEGLKMNVDDLISLADRFSPALNVNLGNILSMFFQDANILNITVDDSFSGDTSTANMNIYHRHMTIDPSIGEYKSFANGTTDYAPAANFEWDLDADGNVKFNNESAYGEDGKMVAMSADEIKELLKGSLSYSYTKLNGVTGQAAVKIVNVSGLDYSILDKPQRVMLVTDMVDGAALSNLLNLVNMFKPDLSIVIPGAVVYTNITVASVQSIEFAQGDDVENAYDENKTYKFGDLLNPQFTATVTYGNGESKEVVVDPDCLEKAFYNYGTRNKAKIDRFGTFDLVYSAFGRTFVKTVKMEDQLIEQPRTNVELELGQEYIIKYSGHSVAYTENGEEKKKTISGSEEDMKILSNYQSMSSEKYYTQSFLGARFNGWKISFSEIGEYDVDVYIGKGYTAKFKVLVKEAAPVMPGYALDVQQADSDSDTITGTVTRADQLGDGLNVAVKVELKGDDGSYTTLENGIDYEIYIGGQKVSDFFIDSFLIQPFEFQIKMLTYGEKTLKVTLTAVDYNDSEVATGENTFDIVSGESA